VPRPGLQNIPEFHFSKIFNMNSSLMMRCYEIFRSMAICKIGASLLRHFSIVFNGTTATVAVRSHFAGFEKAA